jgi:hypothetical protein
MPSSGVYQETARITAGDGTIYDVKLRRDRAVDVPLKLSILRGRTYAQMTRWIARHGWTVVKL